MLGEVGNVRRHLRWETREVCEEARHNCLASLHLPSLPRTNLKKALGRVLPTLYAGTGLTPCLQISTMHQDPAPPPDDTPFPYKPNAYPGCRRIPANPTTTFLPLSSAPRTRMAGSHRRPCHLHTFSHWTKRRGPIAPPPSCKPETRHKSPTTSIETLKNRWHVTRCRRQHPKSHGRRK